ncbi:MAG: mycofactocin biosynthesis glycosyltransferase MftF [Actinobacteria bacterium]|nr:mycofactocin biosynthesis glycosyltransferase MftF [Actinomycetota bacterium]
MLPAPAGLRIALDPGARRVDGGAVLIGGTPLRVLRLSSAGAAALDALAGGAPVPDGRPAVARLVRRLLDAGIAHPRPGPPLSWPPPADVTVVVPVNGPVDALRVALTGVGSVGETIVVDDGSSDAAGIAGAVRARGARLIRHDRARGPAAAREAGWRSAATPVVAFVDADCRLPPGWLDPLLAHLADPAVAAVAPRVRAGGPERVAESCLARYDADRSPLDLGPAEAIVRPRSRVPYVPTATLVVRRAALVDAGGFDAGLRFGEDVDLVWRLAGRGWTVRYEPRVHVVHAVREGLRPWLRQRFDYGTSAAPLARRHGAAVAPVAVSGWSAASWGLAAAGAPAAGATLAAATALALAPDLRGLARPVPEALRIAGLGTAASGRTLAGGVRRAWWPLAAAAVVPSRRARVVAALSVAPLAAEWVRQRPALGFPRWLALRLADDLAYGAGVWAGCARERSLAALRPDFTGGRARDLVPRDVGPADRQGRAAPAGPAR